MLREYRHGVDDPVRPDLLRVVHLDRDPRLDPGAHDHRRQSEVPLAQLHDGRGERRDHGGDDDRLDLPDEKSLAS